MNQVTVSRRSVSVSVRSIENPAVSEWDALRESGSHTADSGERVTYASSLSIPAFGQAVRAISGDVAKLPLNCYKRVPGGKEIFVEHPAHDLVSLTGQPNEETNPYKFWRRFMVSCLIYENGYAWIERNGVGDPIGLYNLLPDRTTPIRIKGRKYYMTEVGGRMEYLGDDEVLHVEGLSIDGFSTIPIIQQYKSLLGGSLAKRKLGSKFFKSNMMAGGILQAPVGHKPENTHKVEAKIAERYAGTDNAFKTLVLRDGYKWFQTQIDPQKAQLAELTEQDAREVARVFNLKPSRVGVAGSVSFNSWEGDRTDYHDGTLSHWLIGIRSECNMKLRSPEEKKARSTLFDYNINALTWADAKTRNEIAVGGIQSGRFSPNETRGWENLNPYDGGDKFYMAMNIAEVGAPKTDSGTASREEGSQTLAREAAAIALAKATVQRAANRLKIKAERAKDKRSEAIAAERSQVEAMLTEVAVVLDTSVETLWNQLAKDANNDA